MGSRSSLWLLPLCACMALVGNDACGPPSLVQERRQIPGYLEAHTPGSGAAEEFPLPPAIAQFLGDEVDLNHVDYVRTALAAANTTPRVILILVPGFLGGAGSFDPLARDLVARLAGNLEVWAVDRRANQLEDRRGGLHARAGAEAGRAAGDMAAIESAIAEGVRFYYPKADLDDDGQQDGAFTLPDSSGGDSSFIRLAQDDMRFAAHWGADTYARDWRELVLHARSIVGESGLVLFGGHSLGTTWTSIFAAYDFDPGPGVEAGYQLVDGLLLLEGNGAGAGSASPLTREEYEAAVADLASPGGNAVYLEDLFGFVDAVDIGSAGELNGIAGTFMPDAASVMQKTPIFGGLPISIILQAPMTNRSLAGFFLDDDFSLNPAFSASLGYSDNGTNFFTPLLGFGEFLIALPEGFLRTWKRFDDPTLPTCPPNDPEPMLPGETGCALIDNGPEPGPGEPRRMWGQEREVTDIDIFIRSLYETGNASEWYFVSGRTGLDLAFGRDATALGAPDLLNTTQNAAVDVPVLGIGGSNGLATTESAFDDYFGSIASSDTRAVILEGYAHVDVVAATDNEAVPPIVDWINAILQQKLLDTF